MPEAVNPSSLPRVELSDLFSVDIDELLDPAHGLRWKELAHQNPNLALKVLEMATRESREGKSTEQVAIDVSTFVIEALKKAFERISEKVTSNVVDEGSRPSTE